MLAILAYVNVKQHEQTQLHRRSRKVGVPQYFVGEGVIRRRSD